MPVRSFAGVFFIRRERDGKRLEEFQKERNSTKKKTSLVFLLPFPPPKKNTKNEKTPKTGGAKPFDVLQPGSTVATALAEGEAAPKHAFLLEIRPRPAGDGGEDGGDGDAGGTVSGLHSYRLVHLPLRSPRPFAFGDVVLRDALPVQDRGDPRKMVELLDTRVERLIASARSASASGGGARPIPSAAAASSGLALAASMPPPKLPLVRLRIDYTDVTTLSSAKLAARYVGRVANPGDIFLWHKQRRGLGGRPIGGSTRAAITNGGDGGGGGDGAGAGAPQMPPPPAELDDRAIAGLVGEYLAAEGSSSGGEFFPPFFGRVEGRGKPSKKNSPCSSFFLFSKHQTPTQAASPS